MLVRFSSFCVLRPNSLTPALKLRTCALTAQTGGLDVVTGLFHATIPSWFHANRIVGGHRDHRHIDRTTVACRAAGSRGCKAIGLQKQSQTTCPCDAQLRSNAWPVSAGVSAQI